MYSIPLSETILLEILDEGVVEDEDLLLSLQGLSTVILISLFVVSICLRIGFSGRIFELMGSVEIPAIEK